MDPEENLLVIAEGKLAVAFVHLLGGELYLLTEIHTSHRTVARVFRLVYSLHSSIIRREGEGGGVPFSLLICLIES